MTHEARGALEAMIGVAEKQGRAWLLKAWLVKDADGLSPLGRARAALASLSSAPQGGPGLLTEDAVRFLMTAAEAFHSLPEDALGYAESGGAVWPLRDELRDAAINLLPNPEAFRVTLKEVSPSPLPAPANVPGSGLEDGWRPSAKETINIVRNGLKAALATPQCETKDALIQASLDFLTGDARALAEGAAYAPAPPGEGK